MEFVGITFCLKSKEIVPRDWLVWSKSKNALFCFPCRLFYKFHEQRSIFATENGWQVNRGYKKLYDRILDHEKSSGHKSSRQIQNETQKWKDLLKRLIDAILFLAERGLAFRGVTHLIDSNNGNFLGLLELLSHYDPLLEENLKNVNQAQIEKQKLRVHYLSPDIQNEFISCCADYLRTCNLKERETMKYYSLIVDATPDSAHIEQTTFILRYVTIKSNKLEVMVRFLAFVDCNKKTREDITNLILETVQWYKFPISDCRSRI
ncbi:uncharacterized protein LOC136091046 [Hydra vulgaris]|uniref:Uncharacterized protein LOC136091046 n=1 Tax=Hydra vulgaris TaxID=6087 RepID=A0ABM4DHX4_HYDVU